MTSKILPGFDSIVHEWVVKKSSAERPMRLNEQEIEDLAKASLEALKHRVFGTGWGRLQELTAGWVVQKQQGIMPQPLHEEDLQVFASFALESLTRSPYALQEGNTPLQNNNEVESVAEELEAPNNEGDIYKYARAHLASCL
ncbi:hypothetical protein [Swingsia samuiensis]|uniref:Uncharacterized protein n=1 Tax=Swingsia samuiensis TaxID=1293412 RepID=A0A4Y6UL49_9PROT|nr:hypothetical protein [Swingsia samuiensis]QDH17121.1 hypothetical protein E3D00_05740 [Swingsia samuiensis]